MKTETHHFTAGDTVTVFNRTPGGTFIVEGRATIVKIRAAEDMYQVKFLQVKRACSQGKVIEPGRWEFTTERAYLRYVDPNGQDDPVAHCKILNTISRHEP